MLKALQTSPHSTCLSPATIRSKKLALVMSFHSPARLARLLEIRQAAEKKIQGFQF